MRRNKGRHWRPFHFFIRFVVPHLFPNMIESYAPVSVQQDFSDR